MTRLGLLLCVLVGAAGSLGACHHEYSEEEKWRVCCSMSIVIEKSTADSAKTIIYLLGPSSFAADTGKHASLIKDESPGFGGAKQNILTALNKFLAGHPKDRPSDYFRELGMTCKPGTAGAADRVRCEIELPVQVECSPRAMGPPPLPEGMPRYIAAQLYWEVDVSQSALLATDAQVRPISGTRLCHR